MMIVSNYMALRAMCKYSTLLTYWLCLPTSMSNLHPIFNVIKLLLTLSNPILGQKANPPPSPELVDGEEHYVVEWILNSQFMRGHL